MSAQDMKPGDDSPSVLSRSEFSVTQFGLPPEDPKVLRRKRAENLRRQMLIAVKAHRAEQKSFRLVGKGLAPKREKWLPSLGNDWPWPLNGTVAAERLRDVHSAKRNRRRPRTSAGPSRYAPQSYRPSTAFVSKRLLDGSTPGPGHYTPEPAIRDGIIGGRFCDARPKSAIELRIEHAADLPGPADYGEPKLKAPNPQKFNISKSKSNLELVMHVGSQTPGPAEYDDNHSLAASVRNSPHWKGHFSGAKPKSDVDWHILRASQIPGPQDYKCERFEGLRRKRNAAPWHIFEQGG